MNVTAREALMGPLMVKDTRPALYHQKVNSIVTIEISSLLGYQLTMVLTTLTDH